MLEKLEIKNFALIDNLSIDLHKGFNVITGETGSGKSIILGALNLLLGEKADVSALRAGSDFLSVTGLFSVPQNHESVPWLIEKGINPEDEDGAILVKRIIKANGRSSAYIQDEMVTRSELAYFVDSLVDIHGQGEHQSLLSSDNQRKILDSYAHSGEISDKVRSLSEDIHALNEEISDIRSKAEAMEKNRDYLKFSLDEIDAALIKDTAEDENLKAKINKASQVQNIYEDMNYAVSFLKDSKKDLYNAIGALSKAVKIDCELASYNERLNSALIETEDIAESISSYLGDIHFSEDEVNAMQERLSLLQKLKRKYGGSLAGVADFAEKARSELEMSDNLDDVVAGLQKKISEKEAEYFESARALSALRSKSASVLQGKIEKVLKGLGMPNAVFRIEVLTDTEKISAFGQDSVSFLFCANPGEDLKGLKGASSGGELSRIMLAVKTVLSSSDSIETQVFDEIDTGIGGSVALSLASCIKELSEKKQVLCVTHLAVLASKADFQFVVSKKVKDGRTFTEIIQVSGDERVKEISRMLSGDDSEAALRHAREMLGG